MQHAIILATKLQTHVRIPDADSDCKAWDVGGELHMQFYLKPCLCPYGSCGFIIGHCINTWIIYIWVIFVMHYSYRNVSRELILCLPIPNWLQWPHSWHVLENHPTRISCTRLKINLFLVASCANIEWIGQAIDLSSQRTFHFNSKPLMWLMPQTHQISFSKCLEFRTY